MTKKKEEAVPKTPFAHRLFACIQELGLTREKVGELCGWENSAARISNYALGAREPTLIEIQKLAHVLRVPVEFLAFGIGQKNTRSDHIPLLLWPDILNLQSVIITDKTPSLLKTQNATDTCYALEIQTDIMCSKRISFQRGTKIIINPDLKPKNNDYVIAHEKGADEPIFRQYVKDGLQIQLNALNPNYRNIMVNENVTILGVVIARVDLFE